jgi:hypothetical protein
LREVKRIILSSCFVGWQLNDGIGESWASLFHQTLGNDFGVRCEVAAYQRRSPILLTGAVKISAGATITTALLTSTAARPGSRSASGSGTDNSSNACSHQAKSSHHPARMTIARRMTTTSERRVCFLQPATSGRVLIRSRLRPQQRRRVHGARSTFPGARSYQIAFEFSKAAEHGQH